MHKKSVPHIRHEVFEYLKLLDYLIAKPCHESQLNLQCEFGTTVYGTMYSKKYIAYDRKTETWFVTELGQEYRDRLRKTMATYCKEHNLI